MDISKELKNFREINCLRSEELAAMLDVTTTTISRWETGKDKPHARNKKKIIQLIQGKDHAYQTNENTDLAIKTKVKEIVIITYMTGKMIAVDKDKAIYEIVTHLNNIENVQLVEWYQEE